MRTLVGSKSLAATMICLAIGMAAICCRRALGADLPIGTAPVVINEVLASNGHGLTDPQGQYDDWIELYNRSAAPVNLAGMYLTDDVAEPTRWQFPKNNAALTTIAARGYLLVWADNEVSTTGLHTAFKLNAGGDSVALFDRDGLTLIDSVTFGAQRTDMSYGRLPDAVDTWSRLTLPTPGSVNLRLYQGFVEKPQVSVPHGFYTSEIQVSMTCPTPGAVIYYTTDGSTPGELPGSRTGMNGAVYTGPIRIKKTTCLRAIGAKAGWYPSPAETNTYLFVNDIITQSPTGAKPTDVWPSSGINGQTIDYGMDPDIVSDPRYKDLMDDALLAIPSLSLVTDLANFFDPQTGIYVRAGSEGPSWERPVSVELIRPDGRVGFQIDAGIRIRGGFSRGGSNAKHSFRLFFRSDYGPPALKYPLFDSEGAEEFENVDLRTAQNYAWSLDSFNPGQKNTFVREEFCRDLQRETGQPYTRTRYYHLYLNGQYWGLYETQERSEASYAATYFGGAADDYDVIMTENHHAAATDGTIDAWNRLWDLCQQGFDTDARYYAAQGKRPDGTDDPSLPVHVDLVNLIDYMLGIFYTGNDDAPVTLGSGTAANNFFAIRNHRLEARFGWKFFAYDNEHSLGAYSSVNDDRTAPITAGQTRENFNPQWLHQKLMVHPEYRLLVADRAHKHFFNGGVMTPEKAIAQCLTRANQIDLAIIAESARWGDQRPSRVNNPYTKEDWWKEVDSYLNKTFFPVRTGIVLNQLRNRGLYPQIAAPVFQINGVYQHGGQVAARDTLSMTGGTIYYTLDGTDPRVPGTNPGATGTSSVLVAENAAKRVLVPTAAISDAWRTDLAFNDSAWISGTGGVGYERSSGYEPFFKINVQTQMYGTRTSCYIRIPFTVTADTLQGLTSLTLKVRYDDAFVAYLNGFEVQRANFTGTPAWNSAATTSCSDSDAVNLLPFDISGFISRLKTGTNLLAIQALNDTATSSDFLNSVELSATKGSAGGATPSGVSPSAIRYAGAIPLSKSTLVKARVLSGTTWSALNEAVFAVGPVAQSLRVSELMYHPLDTGNPNDPNTEFIELTNIANQSINLNLVRFTKGITYTFPSLDLPAGEHCLIVKDLAAFEAKYGSTLPVVGQYGGSLDNSGERIELVDAAGTIIQSFVYDDTWFKTTDGSGYSLVVKDPRTANASSLNDKDSWQASTQKGGSPGRAGP